jgi:CRP-like cAMP-binding protein
VLAREGRPATELVLVVDGRAAAAGSSAAHRTLGAGQFVGELEVVGQADHVATVIAETPMQLLVAGPATLRTVLEQPAVLRHILTGLGEQLRAAGSTATVPDPAA